MPTAGSSTVVGRRLDVAGRLSVSRPTRPAASSAPRIMLSIQLIPALALIIGMFRMPESPRWLADNGYHEKALQVLVELRPAERAEPELAQIETIREEEQAEKLNWKSILGDKWLRRVLLPFAADGTTVRVECPGAHRPQCRWWGDGPKSFSPNQPRHGAVEWC